MGSAACDSFWNRLEFYSTRHVAACCISDLRTSIVNQALDCVSTYPLIQETSLGFLLHPLWVSDYATSDLTPPLPRKGYGKRDHPSDPRPIRSFHWKLAAYQSTTGVYPWSHFKDNYESSYVISRYHPHCLDNSEYFVGSQTHSFRLEGKRVSTGCLAGVWRVFGG